MSDLIDGVFNMGEIARRSLADHVTPTQRRLAVESALVALSGDAELARNHGIAVALRICAASLEHARRDEARPLVCVARSWREEWAQWLRDCLYEVRR